ncbi:MAG: CHY zinc finger protein [Nesterenkonia sp.]|nr:CHY zinc finger protein [Nesterenkonia sp.]
MTPITDGGPGSSGPFGTRCPHYTGPTDVVTIRFHCCGAWYPCLHCHADHESHAIEAWPRTMHRAIALMCRVCDRRFSIEEYLGTPECRGCGATFNPGCEAHHPTYFEM